MAYEFGSISKRMKARKPKTKAGRGFAAGAEGFLQGVQQGMQMGMYRAMQQQKAGMTENEKKAKEILGYKTGIKDPKILSELTIIAQELRRRDITPDEADNLMDAKGLTGPASFAPIVKQIDPIGEKITSLLSEVKDPKIKEDLINLQYRYQRKELTPDEVNEVLHSGMVSPERFEAKPGYTMTAAEVETADLPTAPLGQVWWMGDDGNPTLKGKAKGVDKALKPVRMEHMTSGKAEWFNWDPAQGNFIYQSGKNVGEPLSAEELTHYKPPSSSDFLEMMRLLLGSQPQP